MKPREQLWEEFKQQQDCGDWVRPETEAIMECLLDIRDLLMASREDYNRNRSNK